MFVVLVVVGGVFGIARGTVLCVVLGFVFGTLSGEYFRSASRVSSIFRRLEFTLGLGGVLPLRPLCTWASFAIQTSNWVGRPPGQVGRPPGPT